MPHIHEKPGQHDTTASAFIVRHDEEPEILLHVHKKYGKLLQPGGHVELDENPWQTILREVEEETGYTIDQLMILQPSDRLTRLSGGTLHPQPVCVQTHEAADNHWHTDQSYAFWTNQEPSGTPDEGESQDLRWVSYDELDRLPPGDISRNAREIAQFVLARIVGNWKLVAPTEFDESK